MEKLIKDLLMEYQARFNRGFPVYELEMTRDIIEECLNKNICAEELYDIDYKDVLY